MMGLIETLFNRVRETVTGSKSSSPHEEQPTHDVFDEQDAQFFDSLFDEPSKNPCSPPEQPAGQSASLDGDSPTEETVSAEVSPPQNSSSEGDNQESTNASSTSGTDASEELSELRRKNAELEAKLDREKKLRMEETKVAKDFSEKLKKVEKELELQKRKTINLLQVAFGKKGEKLKNLSKTHRKNFFSALEELSFTSEQVWGITLLKDRNPNPGTQNNSAGGGAGGSAGGGAGGSAGSGAGGSAGSGAGGSAGSGTGGSAGSGAGGSAGSGAGGSAGGGTGGSAGSGTEGESGKGNKQKGNSNLGRKPNSLWDYSPNQAFNINAFNLTEEDLFDLYVPEEIQEKFQKAREEAKAKAEARGLIGQDRINFYIYYLTKRFDIFPTINYFPGFFYTTLNVSPIAKGNDATIYARHTNRLFRTSAATPEVLSHFGYEKYRNGLPVNRLCDMAEAEDGHFERSTVSNWLIEAYDDYLWVVHYALLYFQKQRDLLLGDETYSYARENNVLLNTCYFWGLRTSPLDTTGPQIVSFWFDKNRIKLVPEFYLCDYNGKLQTDGYAAYVNLRLKNGKIVKCGCWFHSRRPVIKALPLGVEQDELSTGDWVNLWSVQAAIIMSEIFHREAELKDLSPKERLDERQLRIAPLVAFLFKLCDQVKASPDFDEHSEEGQAVDYILSRKRELSEFLKDGTVQLSTNDLERCNIIVALVRKRAKIFDSVNGATAAGGYFSLIETAEENGINGELYLRFLLTVMPQIMEDYKGEIKEFEAWLSKAKKRLEEARKKHFDNPKEHVEIDWEGIGDPPSLEFMKIVMPWSQNCTSFSEKERETRKELIESVLNTITMQNLQRSPISVAGIEKILEADAMEDNKLGGLKIVFEEMKSNGAFTEESQAKYFSGPIKNVSLETGSIFTLLKDEDAPILPLGHGAGSQETLRTEEKTEKPSLPGFEQDPGTQAKGPTFTFTDDITLEKDFEGIDFRYLFPAWENLPDRMSLEDAMAKIHGDSKEQKPKDEKASVPPAQTGGVVTENASG